MDVSEGRGLSCTAAVTRPLGLAETWLSNCHQMNGALQMGTWSSLKSKWPLSLEVIRSAAKILQERHPLLRSRIVLHQVASSESASSNSLCKAFAVDEPETAQPVDISLVTYRDWVEAMEAEVPKPYDEAVGPLWRLKLVTLAQNDSQGGDYASKKNSSDSESYNPFEVNVLWLSHHTISDGISQMVLIKDLLTILKQGPDVGSWDTKILGPPGPVPPQFDQLIDPAPPQESSEDPNADQISHDGVKRKGEFSTLEDLHMRMHPIELDSPSLTQLKARCKEEGTTVHGALKAAMLLAARHHVVHVQGTDDAAERPVVINWYGPANVRNFANPVFEPQHVSCSIIAYQGKTTVPVSLSFWELARDFKNELNSFLQKGAWRMPHNYVKAKGHFPLEEAEALFGKAVVEAKYALPTFEWSTGLSNIGDFQFNESGDSPICVTNLKITANTIGLDMAFYINCISYDGRMSLCMTYMEPLMGSSSIKTFAERFVLELKEAVIV